MQRWLGLHLVTKQGASRQSTEGQGASPTGDSGGAACATAPLAGRSLGRAALREGWRGPRMCRHGQGTQRGWLPA